MLGVVWKLTRGNRFDPWNSPYLRWRVETYTGLHAETLSFQHFLLACWKYRKEFRRYLRWAARQGV